MPDKKITQLDSASAATGDEIMVVVQSGSNKQLTTRNSRSGGGIYDEVNLNVGIPIATFKFQTWITTSNYESGALVIPSGTLLIAKSSSSSSLDSNPDNSDFWLK